MTYEHIEFERDGSIGRVQLARPDRLNAFTVGMWHEMRALGQEVRDDASLRVMIVSGQGRAFSSGIDTTVFTGGSPDTTAIESGPDAGSRHADPAVDGILRAQEAYSWLADARYPTIAAVRGYALGAGLQLALARDIRVFARGTQVGLLEHKYGILPDLGGTQRLPRVVGASKAKELIWTAARVDADEAYRIGLCDRLVDDADLEAEVDALAAAIAAQPPLAVQGAKRAVEASGRLPVAEGLVFEAEQQRECLQSADMREAITAIVEQRAPAYKGEVVTRFRVRAGRPLEGRIEVSGATKNSGVKQMAAALLAPGVTTLRNMPPVLDLDVMSDLLRAVGATVDQPAPNVVRVDASGTLQPEAPYELVTRMRASFNVLGPLLARCGEARVALPGGDNIGSRKVDMHLRGLEAMGAQVDVSHGFVHARCDALQGARLVLEFPSVGATENLMCAAVLAKGTTVIENAAREPEVRDLAAFLDRMGARVVGAGTSTMEIEGVEELVPADTEIMADRVEAGTLLMACGIAGGEIELVGTRLEHLEIVVTKLCEMGMRVSPTSEGLWARRSDRLHAIDVSTLPHPGFATDFMPIAVALMSVAEGSAIVTENIYDGRFQFVDELVRMGADVRTEGRHAIVRGVERLSGAPVTASDVRAGAALVLAGLVAEGETIVHGGEHVDRGYSDLPATLRALGADVERLRGEPA